MPSAKGIYFRGMNIYYVGSHNCFQKVNWFAKKQFFCIASNSTRNSLIDRFILSNTLTVPCCTHFHSSQTQKSTSPLLLRRFKLSKRLTRKFVKLLSIILRPKITPLHVTSCESCKQASNNDSVLIPG